MGEFDRPLPDGFGPLADHNLVSFKSHQDTFDGWALLELIGHFVSYRKKVSPDSNNLVPLSEFRVIGITACHPENLAREFTLVQREPGVYDIKCGPLLIHILVIRNMRDSLVNAMLKLFSIVPSQIEFASQAYQQQHPDSTGTIGELIQMYRQEDSAMAVTLEEINRKFWQRFTPEERLEGLPAEERVKGLPARDIIKAALSTEEFQHLTPDELAALVRELAEKGKRN